MVDLARHYLGITRCWIYSAAPSGVRSKDVPFGREIVEVFTGGKVMFAADGGEEKCYGYGSIFWHRFGEQTVHKAVPDDPYRCLAIWFKVANEDSPCPAPRIGTWNSPQRLELFVADMLNLFRRVGKDDSGFLSLYAATTLLRQMTFAPEPELPAPLRSACRIFDINPGQQLDLDGIAEQCGVSKSYLFYLFRKHLGTSPWRYLLERRIEMAKNMLLHPNVPIKSISESCGFHDIEVFYRSFKRLAGTSPGAYREDNL